MTDHTQFDVFLAHNSQDKPLVRIIAEELKQRDLKPWIDEEEIPPGQYFQDAIQRVIPQVKCAAILISPIGMGKWQALELRAFISQCVNRDIPVIPVLLPGLDEIPEPFFFLKELNFVKFEGSLEDSKSLNKLEWGITKKNPNQKSSLNVKGTPSNKLYLESIESKKKQTKFIVEQLQESIRIAESYLNQLQNQKTDNEAKVKQLEEEIAQIELKLRKDMSQKLTEFLDWLSTNQIKLARNAGNFALDKFDRLREEIKREEKYSPLFYWRIEKFLELVHQYLFDEHSELLDYVEELDIPLDQIDVYMESIEFIRGRLLQKNSPDEIKEKIQRSIELLKNCLELQNQHKFNDQ